MAQTNIVATEENNNKPEEKGVSIPNPFGHSHSSVIKLEVRVQG
jgi:hypothetical protein